MNTKFLYILIACFILFSCTNGKLSRSKAKDVIIKEMKLPSDILLQVPLADHTFYAGSTEYILIKYQKAGLLTYHWGKKPSGATIGPIGGLIAELTEQGKKYAVGEPIKTNGGYNTDINVIAAKLYFDKISGMKEMEQFNSWLVEFTIVQKDITPFGEIAGYKIDTINQTVTLAKFDDGWRIAK